MRIRCSVNFCILFVTMIFSVAFQNLAYGAPEQSPLQRPLEDLKRDLAKILKCTWTDEYGSPLCRTEELPMNKVEVVFYRGKIDHIRLDPFLKDAEIYDLADGSLRKTTPADVQQHNVIEAIAMLFPSWKNSRAWVRDAMDRSREDGFQTSLRVNGTSIYVRKLKPPAAKADYIMVVLTLDKDLHRFKERPCEDDAQGHAQEGCGPDDGFILRDPRPPDNPILLLK